MDDSDDDIHAPVQSDAKLAATITRTARIAERRELHEQQKAERRRVRKENNVHRRRVARTSPLDLPSTGKIAGNRILSVTDRSTITSLDTLPILDAPPPTRVRNYVTQLYESINKRIAGEQDVAIRILLVQEQAIRMALVNTYAVTLLEAHGQQPRRLVPNSAEPRDHYLSHEAKTLEEWWQTNQPHSIAPLCPSNLVPRKKHQIANPVN